MTRGFVCAVVLLALAGCGGGHHASAPQAGGGATAQATATPVPVTVKITPGHGKHARPDRGITVRAAHGRLKRVAVHTGAGKVAGTFNQARTEWRTRWALGVSEHYAVTATAAGASGSPVTRRKTFTTATPEKTFAPRTIMEDNGTYGVGMPLIIYFDGPVTNRKAVERSMEVRTSKPVQGSWYWDDTCGIVPLCLYFRPRHYWKPNTEVHFTAHVNGVEASPGVWGTQDISRTIEIGDSVRVVASTATHYMTVYRNGKRFAHWPISTGKPGDDTPNGRYLTIEKSNPEEMIGEDYDIEVPYSVRITWSGAYLHAADWSVGSQGSVNVSHGCINMSPEDAAIFYDMAVPGDPVEVVGSPVAGTWDNGWTMWFKSWKAWQRGSALGQTVRAGPHGSTFS